MIYLRLILYSLLLLLFACKEESKQITENIDINISGASLFGEELPIVTISYTPLETTENSYLGKIHLVKSDGNKIIFLTKQEERSIIYIFLKDGSFYGKIDNPGEGPGEFTALNDFIIDPEEETYELFDLVKSSIIRYNFDLSFKDEIKLNNQYKEFIKFNEGDYAFYSGNKDYSFKNLVYIHNGEEFNKKMDFPLMGFSVEGPHFSNEYDNDRFLIHDSFNDTIYSLSKDHNNFRSSYHLSFGTDFVDKKWIEEFGEAEMMGRMNLMNKSGKVYSFKYIHFSQNILLTAFYNFTLKRFYFDFYNDALNENYIFFTERMLGVPNTFDLGPMPRFLAFRDNNELVFYVDAPDLTSHLITIDEMDTSTFAPDVLSRYKIIRSQLKALDQNDNPVMMTIELDLDRMFANN